jgi:hypothetical protein
MRTSHTQYCKGKRVYVNLREGGRVVGKFVERLRDRVVLDVGEFRMKEIRGMGLWKAQQLTLK